MKVAPTDLPEVLVVEPSVFDDPRGFFFESYNARVYGEAGIDELGPKGRRIVQLNHSHSVRGTLRGLHYQQPHAQGKLVWVVQGSVLDVAVDIRRGSPAFGKWTATELSADNQLQLWIPPGFAHGFCVLSESADCMYACTDYYAPDCEHAIRWNDPAIGIDWRVAEPLLSEKDAGALLLADAAVLPDYPA